MTSATTGQPAPPRAYRDRQYMPAAHTLTVRAAAGRTSGRERGLERHDGTRTRRYALMGAGNVVLVLSNWTSLPDPAFRVLLQMAMTSLDRDSPPRYWGGRNRLIEVMGRGPEPTDKDYQALKRAVRVLVDKGAISVDKHHGRHGSATYILHL